MAVLSFAMLLVPTGAGASVDPGSALHAYARARLADDEGALGMAVESYREALRQDPERIEIARRSYVQGLESGDRALALRSAAVLDGAGMLPRDGTLLLIGEALTRKDWSGAAALVDRMTTEGNFAFLAPIVRSWIAIGEGRYAPPAIDMKDRFAALGARYVDEHAALQTVMKGDVQSAVPMIRRALAVRGRDGGPLRIAFATQLAGKGAKAEALTLLPAGDPDFAQARRDIEKGRVKARPITAAQGYARLLARMAVDIASDPAGATLGLRLARMATFADPEGAEGQILTARLLTGQGHGAAAAIVARQVEAKSWFAPFARAELIDALAEADDKEGALSLARAQAAEPGAGPERQVRLGRLLAGQGDFDEAAAAFRAAQAGFADGSVPWTLLLFEGSALEQGKRWAEARKVLEQAAAIAPNEPMVLNYLGYAQIERRQNVEAALALIKKASLLKPDDPSIADSLGWAQFVTGNVAAALPSLQRAAAGAPADVTINEHLGDALWTAGRRYEARYAWEAASVYAEGEIAARLAAKRQEGLTPEYAAP